MAKNPFIDDDANDGPGGEGATAADEPYRGPERRSGKERRQGEERREEIRFEPDKECRRSGKDRRRSGRWGDLIR